MTVIFGTVASAIGEEQFGAVLDDAAEFLLRAGQEAGDVFEGNQRNVEGVAEAHEARGFDAGVDVENAREECGLIGDDTHRAAVEARKSDDNIFGEVLVDFEEVAVVDDGVDGVLDVVGLLGVFGDERVECFVAAIDGIGRCAARADLRDCWTGESSSARESSRGNRRHRWRRNGQRRWWRCGSWRRRVPAW